MPKLTSVSPVRFFLWTFVLSWGIWIPLDLAWLGRGWGGATHSRSRSSM